MKKKTTLRKSKTDWKYVDRLKDSDIDFSDCPELTPEMFAKTIVRKNLKPIPRKIQVTLRLDSDVLKWFKTKGKGYQTQINALLHAYMDAYRKRQLKRLEIDNHSA